MYKANKHHLTKELVNPRKSVMLVAATCYLQTRHLIGLQDINVLSRILTATAIPSYLHWYALIKWSTFFGFLSFQIHYLV